MNIDNRIIIPMPNGDKLIAEQCDGMPYTIAVGLERNGVWIQDLAVIEPVGAEFLEPTDKYKMLIYGNETQEDYTDYFEVNTISDEYL